MGKNSIVSISNDKEDLAELTWKELHAATFTFDSPFLLRLDDGNVLEADRVARIMPGKRMVVFGKWQGKAVVAKLFFDLNNASRHVEKDVAGVLSLQESRIPTPELYYEGMCSQSLIHALIFEEIKHADNLGELWRQRNNDDDLLLLLQSVVVEIATQHVFGVMQHDIHLDNFLITDRAVYTLDGGQIETYEYLLPKKQSMENLALFLSQFGVGVEKLQEALFKHYAKLRGWLLKKEDLIDIFKQIKRWRSVRWDKFAKKIVRESTQFKTLKGWRYRGVVDRHLASPALVALLEQPETIFLHPDIKLLKAGRSATVIKLRLDGRDYVVKRYNIKSSWHWLRRCLRPSRASKSWRLAHKLGLFGVPTAEPIAFLETHFLGLRGKSYFVSDYIAGEDVKQYFAKHLMSLDRVTLLIKHMVQILRGLRKLDISHGDLKATNILINDRGNPSFIDLDGTQEHKTAVSLRKAWVEEINRFLRNFDDMPNIKVQLEAELKHK